MSEPVRDNPAKNVCDVCAACELRTVLRTRATGALQSFAGQLGSDALVWSSSQRVLGAARHVKPTAAVAASATRCLTVMND